MARVFLALGTNLGDRESNLAEAVERLGACVTVLQVSPTYETDPWGVLDQPDFLNQVLEAETDLAPHDLLRCTSAVQEMMGRKTDVVRYGPRLIDIDILFYDDLVFASYSLTIPHPRLVERAFVLVPLADIAPDFRHPATADPIVKLKQRLDLTSVRPYGAGG